MLSELTPLRLVWLGLTILGTVTAVFGWSSPTASDWVAMAALAVWCLTETMVRRNWPAMLTLPAMALGLGCALPLYLFIRSRRIV